MKANEAPEKLYVDTEDRLSDSILYGFTEKRKDDDIEYTRTDAFIEKAVKWIDEINNHHHIIRYSDCCEPPLEELIEWFKNYIKEGGKDE